jgi:hypothetical protein
VLQPLPSAAVVAAQAPAAKAAVLFKPAHGVPKVMPKKGRAGPSPAVAEAHAAGAATGSSTAWTHPGAALPRAQTPAPPASANEALMEKFRTKKAPGVQKIMPKKRA